MFQLINLFEYHSKLIDRLGVLRWPKIWISQRFWPASIKFISIDKNFTFKCRGQFRILFKFLWHIGSLHKLYLWEATLAFRYTMKKVMVNWTNQSKILKNCRYLIYTNIYPLFDGHSTVLCSTMHNAYFCHRIYRCQLMNAQLMAL